MKAPGGVAAEVPNKPRARSNCDPGHDAPLPAQPAKPSPPGDAADFMLLAADAPRRGVQEICRPTFSFAPAVTSTGPVSRYPVTCLAFQVWLTRRQSHVPFRLAFQLSSLVSRSRFTIVCLYLEVNSFKRSSFRGPRSQPSRRQKRRWSPQDSASSGSRFP